MRNINGMTIKAISIKSCLIAGCKAYCSNDICKKCFEKLKAQQLAQLQADTSIVGQASAEWLSKQIYGKLTANVPKGILNQNVSERPHLKETL